MKIYYFVNNTFGAVYKQDFFKNIYLNVYTTFVVMCGEIEMSLGIFLNLLYFLATALFL